ncbi:hypothetical protein I3F58_24620 [Streptomyces sp. MUM 203J]|uniref:hypothetical protein n=1 Tax=Streptomyces sp. MUM 203J TaxID=2791990 RepID=UPI001F04501B|nr:hypothetical protein [Streptomyces sp. MUM 203J]MCH0542686.1 hypothetical protein [Streptomyces sp. MUM 203J]
MGQVSTLPSRGGHPVVTTFKAAYSPGMKPDGFRSWARRHGIAAVSCCRASGGRGQATALWDVADLVGALARGGRRAEDAA